MRVGTLTLLHEPDSFDPRPTTLADFDFDAPPLPAGGFEAVPLFHARAPRGGPLAPDAYGELRSRLLQSLADAGPLDGLLLEADGSAETDGDWVAAVRAAVGAVPVVAVLAAHANPSPQLIGAVDALVTTRAEAAGVLGRTLRREVRPAMSAVYLPMAVAPEASDSAAARAMLAFAAEQRAMPLLLANAVLFGNPNVDGPHLGATAVVVTDNDAAFARNLADDLANAVWQARGDLGGALPAYRFRPRPLWPFEPDASWEPRGEFR